MIEKLTKKKPINFRYKMKKQGYKYVWSNDSCKKSGEPKIQIFSKDWLGLTGRVIHEVPPQQQEVPWFFESEGEVENSVKEYSRRDIILGEDLQYLKEKGIRWRELERKRI